MAVRHHGVIPYDLPVDHRRIVDLLVRPVWAVLEDRESRGYAAETGPIIGMEVVMAFAVEAGFIGVVLYGDGRVTRGTTQTRGAAHRRTDDGSGRQDRHPRTHGYPPSSTTGGTRAGNARIASGPRRPRPRMVHTVVGLSAVPYARGNSRFGLIWASSRAPLLYFGSRGPLHRLVIEASSGSAPELGRDWVNVVARLRIRCAFVTCWRSPSKACQSSAGGLTQKLR
ncbi:MAG: hypothetical protein QOH09_285 [Pseudonocardiales bacterium]|nr:hypothetical protein [Pseudonocardiales bacterium]